MSDEVSSDVSDAEEATARETARYEKAYRETRRVLDESIRSLMILEEFETSSQVRDQIALKRLEYQTSRSTLMRENIAYHTGRATMSPPSPALVKEIVALAKKSVALTVQRATAAAVIKLATSALKKFSEIQDI